MRVRRNQSKFYALRCGGRFSVRKFPIRQEDLMSMLKPLILAGALSFAAATAFAQVNVGAGAGSNAGVGLGAGVGSGGASAGASVNGNAGVNSGRTRGTV